MDITKLKLRQIRDMLDNGETSCEEIVNAYIERINDLDGELSCFITRTIEGALEQARNADKCIANGDTSELTGIPLAISDNICTKGIKTTAGSKMLGEFIPPYDATVISRLNEQGAIIIGKTNLDEMGIGASTANSHFGITKNPFNIDECTIGSAAGVAAGFFPVGIGADTGGSMLIPAANCGVTSIRPTYGRVSRYGLIANASSFDQIGGVANNAHDLAILLGKIAGFDEFDRTSSREDVVDFTAKIGDSLKGMKIALPKEFYGDMVDDEIKEAVLSAAKQYEEMGAELIEVSIPSIEFAIPAYYIIANAEISSNLARYDGIKFGYRAEDIDSYEQLVKRSRAEAFGDEAKRRILLGNFVLSSDSYKNYFEKALAVRQKMISEFNDVFASCDVILTPTNTTNSLTEDVVKKYNSIYCAAPTCMAMLPSITTTCGYSNSGMPIGMSIIGRGFDEATIIGVADQFERGFNKILPALIGGR